jgi:transcriptional regulator with XRE-family HTH domain
MTADGRSSEFLCQFGQNVRRMRIEAGLPQAVLAERAGLPQSRLSRIERSGANVTLLTVHRLAQALDVRPPDLIS